MKYCTSKIHFILTLSFILSAPTFAEVGGVSGSNRISVTNSGTVKYKIVSASVTGAAVYVGTIDSLTDTNITFVATLDDSNVSVNPFLNGVFNKNVQLPVITSVDPISGSIPIGSFSSSNFSYGTGYQSSRTGFTTAPEIIFSSSDGGGTTAEGTTTITSGEITGITITEGGTDYTSRPDISIIGGPHFVRILDESSSYFGSCFLIENNSETSLKLELGGVNASTYFSADTLIEVVPAATLSTVFGGYTTDMASSTSYRSPTSADWVYLWDPSYGYRRYSHVSGHHRTPNGWYAGSKTSQNNAVIYPDQAFIIAKRISGTVSLDVEVSDSSAPARLYLPASGDLFVANNPYGMDMLLAELIPSTAIGTSGTNKFMPGSDANDTTMDTVSILDDTGWNVYYYLDSVNSDGITELMQVQAKAGTAGSNGLQASDLLIDNGTILSLTSWENDNSAGTVTGNDGNYTYIESSSPPPAGFKVTISGLEGYLLNDDGTSEMNATTGEDVSSGTQVLSSLNGTHEVLFKNGSSGFVIEKQMDINHTSAGDHSSLPGTWNVGDLGTGYTGDSDDQYWFAIGGGGSGASGTVSNTGSFTVTAAGTNYTSAPQIVVSGGGWRTTGSNDAQGGVLIGAEDGIIIHRNHTSGVATEIELLSISD